MHWSIQFYYDKNLDTIFINKLFYFLVSRSIKYNAKYEGGYSIISKAKYYQPGKDIIHSEKKINESTEKLAEIINTYQKYDFQNTSLSINLNYLGEVNFPFSVAILQVENNKSLIVLETHDSCIPDEKTFLSFINLCKEVFDRFNFVFGAFRSQYQDDIPFNKEDFLKALPNIVNFYSKPLVDKIGREKLLSAPAKKVEELENGGIMLLICNNQLGCPKEFDQAINHLGY